MTIKQEFRLDPTPIIISSNTGVFSSSYTHNDFYMPLYFTIKAKNIGYYQFVSNELNSTVPLITGQTSGFTLFNPNYVLPNEPDLSFSSIPQITISGYTSSDFIVSIKGYDVTNPYVVGVKTIGDSTITITEVNQFYVAYQIDLINYTTYFNNNSYHSAFSTLIPNTDIHFTFSSITQNDFYNLIVQTNTSSTTDTTFVIFKNYVLLDTLTLNEGDYTANIKFDLEINDLIDIILSGTTNLSQLTYSLDPEQTDNEANYTTVYSFDNKTLTSINSISDGYIYKSDVQPYHEKPVVNNFINVDRGPVSVYESMFNLGSIGNVNDFQDFFIIN